MMEVIFSRRLLARSRESDPSEGDDRHHEQNQINV
jgi:hypothetical protein